MNRPPLKEIESLEAFAATATFPDTLQLSPGTTQNNPKKYFNDNIRMLKEGVLVPIITQQRLERCKEIREAMESLQK